MDTGDVAQRQALFGITLPMQHLAHMKCIYLPLVAVLLTSCNSSNSCRTKWVTTTALLDFEEKTRKGDDCATVAQVKYARWDPLLFDEADAEKMVDAVRIDLNLYRADKWGADYIKYTANDFDYLNVECDGHNSVVAGSLRGENQYLLRVSRKCYYRFSID